MSASSFASTNRNSQSSSRVQRFSTIALLGLLLSGCASDKVGAPEFGALPWGGVPTGRAPAGIPSADIIMHSVSADSTTAEFTVTPTGGVFHLGPHAIYFPANAICDPATSTYGPTEWDAPCEPLTTPIRFRAEVRHMAGRSWVDFTPAVRFVPTNDPANSVWLYMKASALSANPDSALAQLSRMSVLYSPMLGEPGINEALTDRSLVTYVWMEGGVAFRRIKHFSGYNIYDGWDDFDLVSSDEEMIDLVGGLIISVAY